MAVRHQPAAPAAAGDQARRSGRLTGHTDVLGRIAGLVPAMRARAARHDAEASLPLDDLTALRNAGALLVRDDEVHDLMVLLGQGNPALGRLVEAHVNAALLVRRYGTPTQAAWFQEQAGAGRLFGLWVTDAPGATVRLRDDGTLHGTKAPCSGVGAVMAVLTTVETGDGTVMALLPAHALRTEPMPPIAGMRAARQGRAVFDGVPCPPGALVGGPGDYLREPDLSCGAWRTSAVTLGVLNTLVDALRDHLRARSHADAPLQQERFGRLLITQGTAQLWVGAARRAAEDASLPTTDRVMRVNLARVAVELACLEAIPLVQRSAGLAAFVPGILERTARDLATYLRQPAPDGVLTEAAAHTLHAAPMTPTS